MKTTYPPAILQALLAAVLFGASAPLSKLLLGEFSAIPLAACLYLGSGIGSGLMLLLQRRNKQGRDREAGLSKKDIPWLLSALLAGGVAAPIFLLLGLDKTPASTASLLLNFEAAATTLIAGLVFREAVDRRIWWAVGLITLASILLSWIGGNWGFSLAALGILAACLLWGLDNNLTRHISAKNPLLIVGIKGLGAGALAFILGIPLPGWKLVGLALIVGAVCYGLSIQLFILALRSLGAARTGALFGIAPFIGAVLSLFLFPGSPGLLFWLALPAMLVGAWLMLTEQHHHDHLHLMTEHAHAHAHPDDHHQHEHDAGTAFVNGKHAHLHLHDEQEHAHPHKPDIHHRHAHPKDESLSPDQM
jgi:drug/metabolite transporter (DMT)-like permease